jgi:putative integral membrane protein (TIGR02587 family)
LKRTAQGTAEQDRNSLLRAFAGALFGALPLLFTMEMWWFGRSASEGQLLLFLLLTVGVVALCLLFGGFRRGPAERLTLDLPIAFGAAVTVAATTLLVVGQIQVGRTPFPAAVRMIAAEAVPCAIGAGVALTQLRPRKRFHDMDRRIERLPQDEQKILATIVGAVFFAFNVAPTEEPWKMTMEAEPAHFPLIVVFSLAASYATVFLADFADRAPHYHEGALGNPVAETLVSYLVSLGVSYAFLLAFGHISASTPFYYQAAAAVMLGYVTTMGGSAGRVLVAE